MSSATLCSNGLRRLLFGFSLLLMTGCGPSDAQSWSTHANDYIRFELPSDWNAVPDRRNLLFAPEDERHEQYQIEVRASLNPKVGSRKIRKTWLSMRDISERDGLLISSSDSIVNGFDRFELIRRAPAPSTEIIPLEHQTSGDRIYHQVMLINDRNLSVTARLLVEEADYEGYLPIFQHTLDSITPLVQP